jgi:uncharacterized protein (TIGR02147 family)
MENECDWRIERLRKMGRMQLTRNLLGSLARCGDGICWLSIGPLCKNEWPMSKPQPDIDYRCLLRQELLDRMKRSRAYSSNALARDAGLSSGFFSQLMNGKRSLSENTASKLASRLRWTPKRQKLFMDLVRYDLVKDKAGKALLGRGLQKQLSKVNSYTELDLEKFKIISEWHHFAILELTLVEGFVSDLKWISKRLKISELQTHEAIQRLIQLNLLNVQDGTLKCTKSNAVKGAPATALQSFHAAHLDNAKRVLLNSNFEERDFSGITVSTNPKQIPKVKKLIEEFRRDLAAILSTGPKTHVYHFAAQLFPLSHGTERKPS